MAKDNTNKVAAESIDGKVLLSTMWIFAMFNYLYADVIGLMDHTLLKQILTGTVGSLQITEGFLLGAAILMETAMAMVLLSRLLQYRANRLANIIVGIIHTAAVISSMFVNPPPKTYHVFCGSIEIVCTSLIVWFAWKWTGPEVKSALVMPIGEP
jgi:hypothetical protein